MLKQNDTFLSQYPLRFTGGTAAGQTSSSRNNWNHVNMNLNRNFSEAGFDSTTALPLGYSGIYAEIQSMKPSGVASSTGLAGSGTLTATATMKGTIVTQINAAGVISTSYIYGRTTGSISADINVGSSLSADSVAGAVLGYAVDGTYTVNHVLRIIGAVAGGRVSGGPTNPSFTDLSNTHSVVTGVVDIDGNRSSVTLDPF